MSYEQQNWVTGNRITAEKLNHMEQGIANSGGGTEPLIVNVVQNGDNTAFDKTWQEIYDAFPNIISAGEAPDGSSYGKGSTGITSVNFRDGVFNVIVSSPNGISTLTFKTDAADGYPVQKMS